MVINANCVSCGCTWQFDEEFVRLSESECEYVRDAGYFRTICVDCDPETNYDFEI